MCSLCIGTMREWSRNARGYTAKTEEGGASAAMPRRAQALRGIAANTPLPDFRGFEPYNPLALRLHSLHCHYFTLAEIPLLTRGER